MATAPAKRSFPPKLSYPLASMPKAAVLSLTRSSPPAERSKKSQALARNEGKDPSLAIAVDDEYHTLEYDLLDMEKAAKEEERQRQQKLEEALSGRANGHNAACTPGDSAATQGETGAGAGNSTDKLIMLNPHLKHLLAAIEKNRAGIDLSDKELRNLLVDVKPKGSKWASEEKVGQEELYKACEMVLTELRNFTEHSTPFLVKVNKRDVPDYYDVIKNPMDLGTVGRNLKNFRYMSKAEFADDLYLIYRNCFEYNTLPDNIYRVHAAAMKKKTTVLLASVPDITIRDRADVEMEDESDDEEKPVLCGAPPAALRDSAQPGAEADLSEPEGARSRSQSVAPCRPDEAYIAADGLFAAGGGMVVSMEGDVAPGAGNSQADDIEMDDADEEDEMTTIWREVTRQARVNICREREAVLKVPFGKREPLARDPCEMLHFMCWNAMKKEQAFDLRKLCPLMQQPGRPPAEVPEENAVAAGRKRPREEREEMELSKRRKEAQGDHTGDGYYPCFLPEYRIVCGTPEPPDNPASRVVEIVFEGGKIEKSLECEGRDIFLEEDFFTWDGRKRLRGACPSLEGFPKASPSLHGSAVTVDENIAKLKHIKEIHYRVSMAKAGLPVNDMNLPLSSTAGPSTNRWRRDGSWAVPEVPPFTSPANLSGRLAGNIFKRATTRLLAHAGFDAAESEALQVATEIGAEFLINLGRTAKKYCETYNRKMTPSEILLHTLSENQSGGVQALETYVKTDIEKFGMKLSDLNRRLDAVDKSTAVSSHASETESASQAVDNEEEALMFGGFTEDLGEDFFGFKALGLDKEYSLNQLKVPMRLLKGTKGTAAEGKDNGPGKPLRYLRPPNFPPINPQEEIGLLRPFLEAKKAEGSGKIMEDEYTFTRQLPCLPPTGKLVSKAALAQKKAPSAALLLRRKRQEEERAKKRKDKDEARAARLREKSEKKRLREEEKRREREEKKAKKLAAKMAASLVA